MLKIICDICDKEPQEHDFMFEATILEIKTVVLEDPLAPSKRQEKKVVQLCKSCYKENLEPKLKRLN